MAIIKEIAIHHTGGVASNPKASTQHLTWGSVDVAHEARWNFKSALGYFGGYNVFIEKNGDWKQFRLIGEETAAVYGHNLSAFSVCLAGNFSPGVDNPTKEQVEALRTILRALIARKPESIGLKIAPNTVLDFSKDRVFPHRSLQANGTECYGLALPNDWWKVALGEFEPQIDILQSILNELRKLLVVLLELLQEKKVAGVDRSCDGTI